MKTKNDVAKEVIHLLDEISKTASSSEVLKDHIADSLLFTIDGCGASTKVLEYYLYKAVMVTIKAAFSTEMPGNGRLKMIEENYDHFKKSCEYSGYTDLQPIVDVLKDAFVDINVLNGYSNKEINEMSFLTLLANFLMKIMEYIEFEDYFYPENELIKPPTKVSASHA